MTANRSFSWVLIFLALAWAPPASAGRSSTGIVSVGNGDAVSCSFLNLGKKTLALADLSITVLDSQGAPASFLFIATDCVMDLAPGQGCTQTLDSNIGQTVYCAFTFKGSPKKTRGVMTVKRSGGEITVLPAQ